MILLVFPVQLAHLGGAFYPEIPDVAKFGLLHVYVDLPLWLYISLLIMVVAIQGIWFGRMMNRHQFFESNTSWPMIAFYLLAITSSSQLHHLNIVLFNFVFLYIYQRLFNLNEDELGDYQIHMDIGSVYAVGLLFFPEGIFMLPLILLAVNQFSVFDINRFLLFLLSILIFVVPAIVLLYLYGDRVSLIDELVVLLGQGPSFQRLLEPGFLYTYIALIASVVLVVPMVMNQLSFMQNQNRKIVTVMIIHLVMGLAAAVFASSDSTAVILLTSVPVVFLFAFGVGHVQRRWLINVYMMLLLFALLFIQWVYVFDGLEV